MARIVLATSAYFPDSIGGGTRLAYDLARGLAQRGHQVWLVGEDIKGLGRPYEQFDGVTVLRYRLPPSRGLDLRRHQKHIMRTAEMLRCSLPMTPDVVHGHSLFQYLGALRLYRYHGIRFCYTAHSPVVMELPIVWKTQGMVGLAKTVFGLPIIRRLERECLESSTYLGAESNYTRSLIGQLYGAQTAKRIIVIPGWVDLQRFRPVADREAAKRHLGWPTDRPALFSLRRLAPRMGLDKLLHALSIVRRRGYSFHMMIGGEGPLRARLERLRNQLDLDEHVTLLGFVPEETLPLTYAACDASVIPTTLLECFGITALEALACGRSVLATPVGALPEVVGDFEPRWIARSSSPECIADLICSYLHGDLPVHDPQVLRAILGERYSFARALSCYEKLLVEPSVSVEV